MHVLRSLDDADALRAELTGGAQNVVVIGAGFIARKSPPRPAPSAWR